MYDPSFERSEWGEHYALHSETEMCYSFANNCNEMPNFDLFLNYFRKVFFVNIHRMPT